MYYYKLSCGVAIFCYHSIINKCTFYKHYLDKQTINLIYTFHLHLRHTGIYFVHDNNFENYVL